MQKRVRPFIIIIIAVFLTGCSGVAKSPDVQVSATAPTVGRLGKHLKNLPVVKTLTEWQLPEFITDRSTGGLEITTRHYRIYTSLQDPLILRQVPVFLESAFKSYCRLIGRELKHDKKLLVYLFDNRSQWEDFSKYWTRDLSTIYLKISAGAYYVNGASVAYHIGRQSNFSVLAHEGWHQFSDELFQYRLPAWLDEGLATNFESYQWQNGQVTFSARLNGSRLMSLGRAMVGNVLFRLADLVLLDAGRVISHTAVDAGPDPKVAAYYAQLYAFIRFLREDNYGERSLQLQEMLEDAYLGRWPLDEHLRAEAVQRAHNPSRLWNAAVGKLIFQRYIAADPGQVEGQYHSYCRKILSGVRFKKLPH